eukprot:gene13925-15376_t
MAIGLLQSSSTVVDENTNSPLQLTTLNTNDSIIRAEEYEHAAVATDHETCSKVGRDVLKKGGSAVDGAIASLFCLGTVQFQSTGIGGGGFLLYYEKATGKMHAFDFRETVPSPNNTEFYDSDRSHMSTNGMAVGVPSEVKGLRAAWEQFGVVKWSTLIQPSIDLARNGFKASQHLAHYANHKLKLIKDETLRALITQKDGSNITTDTIIRRPNYAQTLEIIRDRPDDFYTGNLAQTIVHDIKQKGGSMTLDDLENYQVVEREVISMPLGDLTLHTIPLPSGGPILKHILSICKGFQFTIDDLQTIDQSVLTYHRIVEAFKMSYAYRPFLSDPDHPVNREEFQKIYNDVLDMDVANMHYRKIDDHRTYDADHYGGIATREDDGTTHVSLIASNGDAVATTSTINSKFGALFASPTTGIIFNNEIGDSFSDDSPWREDKWSRASTANAPRPGIRPLSSMAPNIILDSEGDVIMVSGGSGGTRITLSVAWVIMMKIWFKMDIGSAVVMSRPYHSLFPEYIRNEKIFPMTSALVDGLEGTKQHQVKSTNLYAVIQAIFRDKNIGKIYAKSDPRKQGKPAGY